VPKVLSTLDGVVLGVLESMVMQFGLHSTEERSRHRRYRRRRRRLITVGLAISYNEPQSSETGIFSTYHNPPCVCLCGEAMRLLPLTLLPLCRLLKCW
jgi:hypothetical protein